MFCSNCGTQVNDGVQFCGNCGNSMTESSKIQNDTQNTNSFNSTQQPISVVNNNNNRNVYYYLDDRRSVLKLILLSLITFNIYPLFFWSGYIKDLNIACDDNDDSPGLFKYILLSLITFGIYSYYWIYKQSNRLLDASNKIGANVKETGTTVLLWTIFTAGIAAPFFLIGNLNKVIRKLKTIN